MSNTRLTQEDFTSIYVKANSAIYRPAYAFRAIVDQLSFVKFLEMLEKTDPAPGAESAHAQALESLRAQRTRLGKAARRQTKLRSRDRPTVRLIDGTPLAEVGPRGEIWATGHPIDQAPRA